MRTVRFSPYVQAENQVYIDESIPKLPNHLTKPISYTKENPKRRRKRQRKDSEKFLESIPDQILSRAYYSPRNVSSWNETTVEKFSQLSNVNLNDLSKKSLTETQNASIDAALLEGEASQRKKIIMNVVKELLDDKVPVPSSQGKSLNRKPFIKFHMNKSDPFYWRDEKVCELNKKIKDATWQVAQREAFFNKIREKREKKEKVIRIRSEFVSQQKRNLFKRIKAAEPTIITTFEKYMDEVAMEPTFPTSSRIRSENPTPLNFDTLTDNYNIQNESNSKNSLRKQFTNPIRNSTSFVPDSSIQNQKNTFHSRSSQLSNLTNHDDFTSTKQNIRTILKRNSLSILNSGTPTENPAQSYKTDTKTTIENNSFTQNALSQTSTNHQHLHHKLEKNSIGNAFNQNSSQTTSDYIGHRLRRLSKPIVSTSGFRKYTASEPISLVHNEGNRGTERTTSTNDSGRSSSSVHSLNESHDHPPSVLAASPIGNRQSLNSESVLSISQRPTIIQRVLHSSTHLQELSNNNLLPPNVSKTRNDVCGTRTQLNSIETTQRRPSLSQPNEYPSRRLIGSSQIRSRLKNFQQSKIIKPSTSQILRRSQNIPPRPVLSSGYSRSSGVPAPLFESDEPAKIVGKENIATIDEFEKRLKTNES